MPFLLWLSTGLSTISLLVSLAALWFSQRNIRLPKRKLDAIETALGDIDYALESLRSTDKRLNARIGMREARAKLAANRRSRTPAPACSRSATGRDSRAMEAADARRD